MSDYKLLINGALVDGDASMDVINPATEEAFAQAPRASSACATTQWPPASTRRCAPQP